MPGTPRTDGTFQLIGGSHDPIVAPGMLRSLFAALRRHDRAVSLRFFPGALHWFAATFPRLTLAQAHAVAFLPNYVGYGPSGGKVGDAYEDTQDVENGLQALARIRGLRVERNATYLLGFSIGGAVGMLLAEKDRQVRAVALDSPWPGARMSLAWYQTNYFHLNRDELLGYKILTRYEGSNTANRWYRRNSYGCQDVHMPLLIVGGTEDDIVPQAMLTAMAANLKGCGQNVEFKLFPGGHAPYDGDVQALIQDWFQHQGILLQL